MSEIPRGSNIQSHSSEAPSLLCELCASVVKSFVQAVLNEVNLPQRHREPIAASLRLAATTLIEKTFVQQIHLRSASDPATHRFEQFGRPPFV